jgi:ABC-type multidrug transport system permease subunit
MSVKRVLIATFVGFLCGLICWKMASSNGPMQWQLSVSIILTRTLLGFGIGISSWKLSWWLHGIILGIIFSIPMAFSAMMAPSDQMFIFWGTIIMGAIYGVIIELVTSVIFKARLS